MNAMFLFGTSRCRRWVLALLALSLPVAMLGFRPAATGAVAITETHPRLFFQAADIPALRAKAEANPDIWQPVLQFVVSQTSNPPPATAPVDGDQDTYRSYGNQIIPFAFACLITENEDYCNLAKTTLLTYATWTQWDTRNQRSLGLAHMLLGNALAYDWLYDRLAPQEQQTVGSSLAYWTNAMYQASTSDYDDVWDNWWRSSYVQNHFLINHSALGLAALALLGESLTTDCTIRAESNVNMRTGPGTEFEVGATLFPGNSASVVDQTVGSDGFVWWQTSGGMWVRSDVVIESGNCETLSPVDSAQIWIDRAAQQVGRARDILEGIGDGSWHEGIKYQQYALSMALPFMINLQALQGIDLIPHTYLRNFIDWRLYNHLPNSEQFIMAYANFEWDWGSANTPSLLRFLAAENSNSYSEWLAREIAAAGGRSPSVWETPWFVLELLYYDPAVDPQPPDDSLPQARTFPDLEGVIWRTGWDVDDLVFGLKTGPYGGRFAFDAFTQERYPWDPACTNSTCQMNVGHDHDDTNTFYLYQAGQWLVPETVGVGNKATEFHNTILVNTQGQYRPADGTQQQRPANYIGTDGYLEATADTPNFNYVAADATRRYQKIFPDIQDITRYVVFLRPDYFVMVDSLSADQPHTYEWVSHFGSDTWIDGRWAYSGAGQGTVLGIGIAAPEAFNDIGGNDGTPYIRIRPESPVDDVRFVNIIYPTTHADWDVRPDFSILDDNGQGLALRVHMHDGSTDDVLITYTDPVSVPAIGPYTFDGRSAVIRRAADGSLTRLFIYTSTTLTDTSSGQVLAANLDPNVPFEAIYEGQTVTVSGTLTTGITLYAPNITTLVVNGVAQPFTRDGDYIVFGG
jgi:hypothetical protein